MKQLTAILAVVSVALGCSAGPAYVPPSSPTAPVVTLHADIDFTAPERDTLNAAAKLWSDQTSGQAQITIVYDLDFASVASLQAALEQDTIIRTTSETDAIKAHDCESAIELGYSCSDPGGPKVLAFVNPSGGIHNPFGAHVRMVVVADRVEGPDERLQVELHEFGHVLGVPHIAEVSGIMYPSHIQHKNVCLTPPDLAEFCKANVCTKPTYPCGG